MIPKIAPWKKTVVEQMEEVVRKGGVLAVIDVHGVPAGVMLDMRANLRENMDIVVGKKTLMKLVWDKSGLKIDDLEKLFGDAVQPALVQTNNYSSFELFKELKKTEAGRAAKPGDIAPEDIIVEKHDTGMAPGPIVGELNTVGIPAKIMKGSVHIQKQVTVLNEGETFEGDLGMLLSKLGINPIITGLRLTGTLENNVVFSPDVLDIDYDGFRQKLISGAAGVFNLACNISWLTPTTMPTLIAKAASESLSVAIEAKITNSKTIEILLAKANASALGIASQLDAEAIDEDIAALLGAAAQVASTSDEQSSSEDTNEEAEEESEEEEEEASFGGLGDLFG
tara:strand:+ start:335 stop:1351 length:1017 start_codon:yes stop_codon:yes gene_type:complete